ncbi:MAG: oligosaccharide flippase family protein [Ignavibacterium sp.]|nr:oligosaccharide flippase family protein [Ignavibacterium sp.]MDW8375128.1 oligosaccharide flippase family protein [Ignavibacteriales bacterium]
MDISFKELLNKSFQYYILQFVNILFPILIVPFIIKKIGIEKYGILAFISSVIGFFQILIDYGFNIYGVKEISANIRNKKNISIIFNSIFIIRTVLFVLSILFLFLLSLINNQVKIHLVIYFFSILSIFSSILYPMFLFQGLEKINFYLFPNVSVKIFYLMSLILIIQNKNDYWKVPILYSVISIVISIISIIRVRKLFSISFFIPEIDVLIKFIKEGWYYFSSNLAISIYTNSTTFILGIFSNNIIVGVFNAFEKLISLLQHIVSPFYQTLFPHLTLIVKESPNRAKLFIKKLSRYLIPLFILITIIVWAISKNLLLFIYGKELADINLYFNIFSLKFLFVSVAYLYANLFLIIFGYRELWQRIILKAFLIFILLSIVFLGFLRLELLGMIISIVLTELFVLIDSLIKYFKLKDQ